MKLNCIRSPSNLPPLKYLRCLAGNIALSICPSRGRRIARDPFSTNLSKFDRLVRNGLFFRALRDGDHDELARYLASFWRGPAGKAFHADFRLRFEDVFLKHHVRAVEAFERIASTRGGNITRLYEIGCGSGQVLDHLRRRLVGFENFVGIDLSEDQVAANRETFKGDPGIEFVAANASSWIVHHARPGALILTNGGVFELFAKPAVQELFKHIATALKPAAVVAIETIGNDHDLETELGSIVFGPQMGFSHNYPHLLSEAGFTIEYQEERIAEDQNRWLLVAAICE